MENKNINQKWVNMVNNAIFPIILTTDNGTVEGQGLTKRELFAALAMQSLLKNTELGFDNELEVISQTSVQYADALISELNKEANVTK